jgi:hypothetical protein
MTPAKKFPLKILPGEGMMGETCQGVGTSWDR